MPRRPRIALAEVPIHVIQRGNNRCACFSQERDYELYLDQLTELAARFDCAVHAYVLMTNHVHLLLTPARPEGISLLMKNLGQRHAQHMNRAYERSGTLWEGRFRSCIAGEEDYVLCCYRYIELNPVRAQMVAHPRDFRWSSYRINAEGASSDLVVPHDVYLRLGQTLLTRQRAYQALFPMGLGDSAIDEIRRATNGNLALGSDGFKRRVEQELGRRATQRRASRPTKSRNRGQTTISLAGKSWSDPD